MSANLIQLSLHFQVDQSMRLLWNVSRFTGITAESWDARNVACDHSTMAAAVSLLLCYSEERWLYWWGIGRYRGIKLLQCMLNSLRALSIASDSRYRWLICNVALWLVKDYRSNICCEIRHMASLGLNLSFMDVWQGMKRNNEIDSVQVRLSWQRCW